MSQQTAGTEASSTQLGFIVNPHSGYVLQAEERNASGSNKTCFKSKVVQSSWGQPEFLQQLWTRRVDPVVKSQKGVVCTYTTMRQVGDNVNVPYFLSYKDGLGWNVPVTLLSEDEAGLKDRCRWIEIPDNGALRFTPCFSDEGCWISLQTVKDYQLEVSNPAVLHSHGQIYNFVRWIPLDGVKYYLNITSMEEVKEGTTPAELIPQSVEEDEVNNPALATADLPMPYSRSVTVSHSSSVTVASTKTLSFTEGLKLTVGGEVKGLVKLESELSFSATQTFESSRSETATKSRETTTSFGFTASVPPGCRGSYSVTVYEGKKAYSWTGTIIVKHEGVELMKEDVSGQWKDINTGHVKADVKITRDGEPVACNVAMHKGAGITLVQPKP